MMKMQDHFALPLKSRERTNASDDARGDVVILGISNSLSNSRDSIRAATHAINCHDELVAALEAVVLDPWFSHLSDETSNHITAILTKAKGV